ALLVRGQPSAGDVGQDLPDRGELLRHRVKIFGLDPDQLDVIQRGARGDSRAAAQQADLPEVGAAPEVGDDHLPAGKRLADLHEADSDQIEAVGGLPLAADHLAGIHAHQLDVIAQTVQELVGEAGEDGNPAQVGFQSPLPILAVDLRPEPLAPLENVEDVAQHLENFGFLYGADGGRPRVKA